LIGKGWSGQAAGGRWPLPPVPSDGRSFEQLPAGALEELLANKGKLRGLLEYQIVAGPVTAARILSGRSVNPASGQDRPTADLDVTRANIPAANGVLLVADEAVLPPR
jgi:uncharacterized surface protein with fasciclin (FAS1) repeats